MGNVLFFQGLGTTLAALPAAVAIDYLRLKKVMIAASLVNALAFVLLTFITEIRLLYAIAMFAGAGWTVHFVIASPFFMRSSSPSERTHLFSVNYALDWTAGLLGALIGGFIPKILATQGLPLVSGYRIGLLLGAVMTLSSAFFYLKIDTPKPMKVGRVDWRKYVSLKNRSFLPKLCLPQFLIGLGAGLVIPFLNIYFAGRFALDSAAIGKIFSVGQIFTVIGFLAGPVLTKKMGLIRVVAISQMASIPFFLVLAFSYQLPPVILAFWFRGSLMNMSWPLFNNFAMEIIEPDQHAGVNSLLMLSWNGSWMFSTLIGGQLIEHFGFVPVMLTTIFIYATVSILLLLIFKKDLNVGIKKVA